MRGEEKKSEERHIQKWINGQGSRRELDGAQETEKLRNKESKTESRGKEKKEKEKEGKEKKKKKRKKNIDKGKH